MIKMERYSIPYIFPDVALKFPFRGRGFYSIRGVVVEDFGVAMIEVSFMERIPFKNKKALPMMPMLAGR
jgi:hypothetical protein